MPQPLRPLVDALSQEAGRGEAADALARAVGARHLLLYVQDPEIKAMLPAPGLAKTLVAGPSFRAMLRRCAAEENLSAEVEALGRTWQATAVVKRNVAFVLLGEVSCSFPDDVVEALPLLAEVLRTQQALRLEMAGAADARDAAARAHQLAAALDASRVAAGELNLQLRLEHQHKDEFLAMLAHELRNPMAPVITGLAILGNLPPRDVAGRDKQLAIMNRQMLQLTHLVDDLLDVSRVSRGQIELRLEVLSLNDVVSAAIEATKPLLASRRHTLVQDTTAADLHVLGDRVRLIQVFSNLLNNAMKYTEPGGRVGLHMVQSGAAATVSVRDNGIGIPRDMLEDIFAMFHQVPGSLDRAPGGLGIGLTLVRTLVGLHGGEIQARSEGLDCGSEFVVTLPLVNARATALPEEKPGPSANITLHVLIVDDNVDAASTLAEVLRMWGARVTVAHDAAAALEVGACAEPPQLVLLDIGLPGMNGYEAAREWRTRFGASARLVAITGYGSAEDRRRTARSGFDAHLVKPVAIDILESLLQDVQGQTERPSGTAQETSPEP